MTSTRIELCFYVYSLVLCHRSVAKFLAWEKAVCELRRQRGLNEDRPWGCSLVCPDLIRLWPWNEHEANGWARHGMEESLGNSQGAIQGDSYHGKALVSNHYVASQLLRYAENAQETTMLLRIILWSKFKKSVLWQLRFSGCARNDISQVGVQKQKTSVSHNLAHPWITLTKQQKGNPPLVPWPVLFQNFTTCSTKLCFSLSTSHTDILFDGTLTRNNSQNSSSFLQR